MPGHILFDLDGTVADTAPDLALALNLLRLEYDMPPLDFREIRSVVSLGAVAMIKLAFKIPESDPEFEKLRNKLLEIYSQNICAHTTLFPGMASVLDHLDTGGYSWGIVTNKPAWLTGPLMEALNLNHRAGCIVSGDTLSQRKPSPEPLLHACKLMACLPADTTYIGDTATDILAGVNAGMFTGVARYGYLESGATPHNWGADILFETPLDILHWLQAKS